MTMNRFCSSGLQTLATGAAQIQAGWNDIVLTGGVESMSMVPMGGQKPSPNPYLAEEFPQAYESMGITSENVATRYGITREDQDAFAAQSQNRAVAAIAAGRFKDEIIPIEVTINGSTLIVRHRRGPSRQHGRGPRQVASRLQGGRSIDGGQLVADLGWRRHRVADDQGEGRGTRLRTAWPNWSPSRWRGSIPTRWASGRPRPSRRRSRRPGLTIEDIGLVELNEAFASQALYCVNELGFDPEIVNVNGGAIALGHPLGCTGAKLTATLLHEMKRREVEYGIVSMCIGGGMGAAAIFKRL